MAVNPSNFFSSKGKSSQYKRLSRQSKLGNLSLERTPKSLSLKKIGHRTKTNPRNNEDFSIKCDLINKKLMEAEKSNHFDYFNHCNVALQELIALNLPISPLISQIHLGLNQYISDKEIELKKFKKRSKILNLEKNFENSKKKKIEEKCKTASFSILNRMKKRSLSRKKIKILREDHDFSASSINVPKLNISKIIIARNESSEKITNTRDDTVKKYTYQDYQDEFMAKYNEFSQSWRELIQEKSAPQS